MTKPQRSALPLQFRGIRAGLALLSHLSPTLTAKIANQLWSKTSRFPEPKREARWLAQAVWKSVRVNQQRIQLYQWGDPGGVPVLLIHGWNGRAAQLGNFALALSEQGYRVIGFDAPAHGRSPGKQTNVFAIGTVINAILDQEGTFAGAISHSFGGLCLLHAATQTNATKFNKLVCIAMPYNLESLFDQFVATLRLQRKVSSRQNLLLQKQFGDDVWERISVSCMSKKLTAPGLIIHDRRDKYISLEAGRRVARTWKNSELIESDGLGHHRILRDDHIVATVVKFLGSSDAQKTSNNG